MFQLNQLRKSLKHGNIAVSLGKRKAPESLEKTPNSTESKNKCFLYVVLLKLPSGINIINNSEEWDISVCFPTLQMT